MADHSRAELEDELAIQQVILSSLDGETFEGVESERTEARQEIARLQRLLKETQGNEIAGNRPQIETGESSNTGSRLNHRGSDTIDSSRDSSAPATPPRRHGTTAMAEPQSGNDIWGPPGSGSLASRNRKRKYDATTLHVNNEHQNKSRRITPTPFSPSSRSNFSTQGSEIIDLTGLGDDNEQSSNMAGTSYLARLKREEAKRAQEKRDREYAFSIFSVDAAAPPLSQPSASSSQQDALQRIMATQRANAYHPSQRLVEDASTSSQSRAQSFADPSVVSSGHNAYSDTGANDLPRMPGAYDPAWDETRTNAPNISTPNTPLGGVVSRPGTSAHQSPASGHHDRYRPSFAVPASSYGADVSSPDRMQQHMIQVPSSASEGVVLPPFRATPSRHFTLPDGPLLPGPGNGVVPPNMSAQDMPARGLHPGQSPGSRRKMPTWGAYRQMAGTFGSALSHVINQTAGYDFANRTDAFGNPLPAHIASLLSDADPYGDPAITERELNELLQNIEPDVQVPKGLQGVTPEALTTPLYKHQEVALTWMKKMEDGSNKGGILADDMGLGKTISTLALIHERKSTSRPKTNLIIGPVALIRQWEEEISRKTKALHRLSVFVYHGRKAKSDELMGYDVVLTTYGTISAELRRREKWFKAHEGRERDYNDPELAIKCPLLHPTKAKFHRVILDEAQCIKNKDTQTAKACHLIKSTYRWCLTGTPMMNGVVELYSLLKFLQIKPYCVWEQFRQSFGILFGKRGDSKSSAMRRLRVLLRAILLRRKKDSLIDGKPIVELPKKTEEITYSELNEDERDFYRQLESKSQVIFNKYLREGSVGKNYANVLVLLLRLRQACCHPHLNLDVEDAAPDVDDDMLERVKKLEPSTVNRIKQVEAFECPVCYDAVTSPLFFFPCGHDCCRPCVPQLIENAAQSNIQAGTESSKVRCPQCRSEFDPKLCFAYEAFTQVHMPEEFAKRKAEQEAQESDVEGSDDSDFDSDADSEDGNAEDANEDGNLEGFVVRDSESEGDIKDEVSEPSSPKLTIGKFSRLEDNSNSADECAPISVENDAAEEHPKREQKHEDGHKSEDGVADDASAFLRTVTLFQETEVLAEKSKGKGKQRQKQPGEKKTKKKKGKGKGKETAKVRTSDIKPSMLKALRKESLKSRVAHKKYMAYLRATWLPSAKVNDCVQLLKDFAKDGHKTIIFSQWTLLLDLIEVAMGHDDDFDRKPARYDGSMTAHERSTSAQTFRDSRDCKVLLTSLRAGNAGLNLTAASRVIIMDPFWNPYIEMQAVDRAYRIGQKNEVKVYRILTHETVEDRIVALQERKKELVEAALDENANKQIGRLSVRELKFLFNGK